VWKLRSSTGNVSGSLHRFGVGLFPRAARLVVHDVHQLKFLDRLGEGDSTVVVWR
jgi:hypothetical protein